MLLVPLYFDNLSTLFIFLSDNLVNESNYVQRNHMNISSVFIKKIINHFFGLSILPYYSLILSSQFLVPYAKCSSIFVDIKWIFINYMSYYFVYRKSFPCILKIWENHSEQLELDEASFYDYMRSSSYLLHQSMEVFRLNSSVTLGNLLIMIQI